MNGMADPRNEQRHQTAPRVGPIYQHGNVVVDAIDIRTQECEFGVQIAEDGRVWICVNGGSWLRFKPT